MSGERASARRVIMAGKQFKAQVMLMATVLMMVVKLEDQVDLGLVQGYIACIQQVQAAGQVGWSGAGRRVGEVKFGYTRTIKR